MSSVSSQIQRAINQAISDQILPQIQATSRSGQGQVPERRWEVPTRRQGFSSEEALNRRFRSSSRDEYNRDSNRNEVLNNTCDTLRKVCPVQQKSSQCHWDLWLYSSVLSVFAFRLNFLVRG